MRGDVIDVFPADSEQRALRIELFDDEVDKLSWFDPLSSQVLNRVARATIYPKTHYATPREVVEKSVEQINRELDERLLGLRVENRLVRGAAP